MEWSVTKKFNWAMAHRLENHEGLCNSVHGHTYKLFVTVRRKKRRLDKDKKLTDKGMIIDFKNLKNIVNEVIVNKLDHAFVYNEDDNDSKSIAKVLKGQINQKLFSFSFRTTAENMVRWMFNQLNDYFDVNNINIECCRLVLYETDSSYATFELEGNVI